MEETIHSEKKSLLTSIFSREIFFLIFCITSHLFWFFILQKYPNNLQSYHHPKNTRNLTLVRKMTPKWTQSQLRILGAEIRIRMMTQLTRYVFVCLFLFYFFCIDLRNPRTFLTYSTLLRSLVQKAGKNCCFFGRIEDTAILFQDFSNYKILFIFTQTQIV